MRQRFFSWTEDLFKNKTPAMNAGVSFIFKVVGNTYLKILIAPLNVCLVSE